MRKLMTIVICACWLGVSYGCSAEKSKVADEERVQQTEDMNAKKPIKANTTKILYTTYTNSGIAVNITYEISRGSLTWDYYDYREGHHLRDSVQVDAVDYDALVSALSQISFSAKDMDDVSSGGSGYSCAFKKGDKTYFHFNDTYKFKGDYQSAVSAIAEYVEKHPTQGETECGKCLKALNEEKFHSLPKELEKYRFGK